MAITDDLDIYLRDWETATVDGNSIRGIEGAGWVDEGGVARAVVTFLCKASDVTAITGGESVTLSGSSYTVAGPPERNGDIATLHLITA